jgi:hypothetical protein
MRFFWAFMIWCCAAQAQAGAWPRAAGDVFIVLSQDAIRQQLYAEYGARNDWTLGVEVTMPKGRRLPDVSQFAHHPVWRGKGGAILSLGVAGDLREAAAANVDPLYDGVAEMTLRLGAFWGKGFATRWGDGWGTIDVQVERIVSTNWLDTGLAYKVDAGLGFKPWKPVMITAQAQYWRRDDDKSLRIETGAALSLGPAKFVVQPSVGVIGPKDRRIKMALWLEF